MAVSIITLIDAVGAVVGNICVGFGELLGETTIATNVLVGTGVSRFALVSVAVSIIDLAGISTVGVFVTSTIDFDGLKIPIGTLHKKQSRIRLIQPKPSFPTTPCFLKIVNHQEKKTLNHLYILSPLTMIFCYALLC